MKRCRTCGISKPATAYTKQKQRNGKYLLAFECKECACNRQSKRYQILTPEQKLKKKEKFIQRTYGIDLMEFNRIFSEQQGKCASCGIHQSALDKSLVIDHCHNTKLVRGLLCSGCNLALGNVKESAETLEKLAVYIRKFK